MRRFLFPVLMALSACMPVPSEDTPTRAAVVAPSSLPPMKVFTVPRPTRPALANSDLIRDFLDLAFRLESGRDLAVFTRFEGPISIRLTGAPPVQLS